MDKGIPSSSPLQPGPKQKITEMVMEAVVGVLAEALEARLLESIAEKWPQDLRVVWEQGGQGNIECMRDLARLVRQINSTPAQPRWRTGPSSKCLRWLDDFLTNNYPEYDPEVGRIVLNSGIVLEPLFAPTKGFKEVPTTKSLFGVTTGAMSGHAFVRVTFPNGFVAYFDLGSSTTQGDFGGKDHWWLPWSPEGLDFSLTIALPELWLPRVVGEDYD